jgi:hypothetical protein
LCVYTKPHRKALLSPAGRPEVTYIRLGIVTDTALGNRTEYTKPDGLELKRKLSAGYFSLFVPPRRCSFVSGLESDIGSAPPLLSFDASRPNASASVWHLARCNLLTRLSSFDQTQPFSSRHRRAPRPGNDRGTYSVLAWHTLIGHQPRTLPSTDLMLSQREILRSLDAQRPTPSLRFSLGDDDDDDDDIFSQPLLPTRFPNDVVDERGSITRAFGMLSRAWGRRQRTDAYENMLVPVARPPRWQFKWARKSE